MATDRTYVAEMTSLRREKDAYFRQSPDSPFAHHDQSRFKGLRYFAPDPAWRVNATVDMLPEGPSIIMATSDGQQRPFIRAARLHFSVSGQDGVLTAYRSAHNHHHAPGEDHHHEDEPWFIPFRDALAGKETYGAGRYLDIEPREGEANPSAVILDFNLAYNPYCAYAEEYSCPIPPKENTLSVAVRAGEQTFHP